MTVQLHRHFKLYKPIRTLSQFVNNQMHRRNKGLLGGLHDFPEGTMAIGRLDENSEGLLLLTTDGKVSYELLSRKYEKEYYVQVDGLVDGTTALQLEAGVPITIQGKPYTTLPCRVRCIDTPTLPAGWKIRDDRHGPTSWLSVTLTEGKYRQVRKMTAAVGYPTLRLVRVRVGNITLADMQPGEVIEMDNLLS